MFCYTGTPQRSQGNHIRFDSEENDLSTDVLNNAVQPIAHPQILSLRQTNAPGPSGTPNLSPIEPNTQSCFSSKKSVNGPNGKFNNQRGGKGGNRKDSYTNRSQILESTRVDKDAQPQVEINSITLLTISWFIFEFLKKDWFIVFIVVFIGSSVYPSPNSKEGFFSVFLVTWPS